MNFTICLVGYGNVGKTAFVNKQKQHWNFRQLTDTTYSTQLQTGSGRVNLTLITIDSWEYKEGQYDAEIVMYDLTRPNTLGILKQISPSCKLRVIVGNKFDLKDELRVTDLDKEKIVSANACTYYDISTKTGHNSSKPIAYLLQQLVNQHMQN